MTLDRDRALDDLAATTTRLAALVAEAEGSEPVPACGGWTVRDLAVHVGTVHRWAASIVLSGQRQAEPAPLVTEPLADWYAGCAAALLAALRAVDPDEEVPNFARVDETAAFWPRRQLHETTIHAIDAAQALGRADATAPVPADLAADGVDEVLRVFFPRMTARGERPHVTARVRLEPTDHDDSWVVAPGIGLEGAPVLLPAGATPDATIRGTASDLYLALWKRVPTDRLNLEGDAALALVTGPTVP